MTPTRLNVQTLNVCIRQSKCALFSIYFLSAQMPRTPSKKDIPSSIRVTVVPFPTERLVAGKLAHGSINAAASKFGVSVRWVRNVLDCETIMSLCESRTYLAAPRSRPTTSFSALQRSLCASVKACDRSPTRPAFQQRPCRATCRQTSCAVRSRVSSQILLNSTRSHI